MFVVPTQNLKLGPKGRCGACRVPVPACAGRRPAYMLVYIIDRVFVVPSQNSQIGILGTAEAFEEACAGRRSAFLLVNIIMRILYS